MMIGHVDRNLDAVLTLTAIDSSENHHEIVAVVDTGYNGTLMLPTVKIAEMRLSWTASVSATLADGSTKKFDVFNGTIRWHGNPRSVEIDASNGCALIGMSLLEGDELRAKIIPGGMLTITSD